MAQFEYVTTLVSFVVAFGVSRLLAGWARQYVQRARTPIYPLQVAASVLLLVGLLQSTWAFWVYRDVSWTFGTFLFMLLTQLALVGASALIHPPDSHSSSVREYYFEVRHAVFGLAAIWIVLGGILDFILIESIPAYTSFDIIGAFRTATLCVLAIMVWSDRPAHHWVGLVALTALQIGFVLGVSNNPAAG